MPAAGGRRRQPRVALGVQVVAVPRDRIVEEVAEDVPDPVGVNPVRGRPTVGGVHSFCVVHKVRGLRYLDPVFSLDRRWMA